uniref:reverse transcriptase domain-containing protein n=1 Tax=Bacteroides cellulosilyticus TaxID=246787 RepID=UPI004026EAAB
MDRKEIVNRVNRMDTKADLLSLLNDLKADDLGSSAYPFTMKQINYYCNPNKNKRRYTQFEIPKKSGGKRQITAPVRTLKSLLTYVNIIFQAMYEPLPCVTGFIPKNCITDNAKFHIGKHYVFNIDMKDFFPSIAQARVWAKLQLPPFNFKDSDGKGRKRRILADVIAGMCCMKIDNQTDTNLFNELKSRRCNIGKDALYVLPQGAPTSPILTNIICERLDWKLSKLAKHYGVTYSRYADDITFSSMHNVYQKDSEFTKQLREVIESQNFVINPAKTRLLRVNQRQEVTGLTVNVKSNVARKYVQDVRHILHTWATRGYQAAYAEFYPRYKAEKGHVKKGEPVLENVLSGKMEYLKMVKGSEDTTYKRLNSQLESLVKQYTEENVQFAGSSYRYIVSYSISQFEDAFQTKIEIDKSKNGKDYVFCQLSGKKTFISISKTISIDEVSSENKPIAISYCETDNGKRFYLIHRPIEQEKTVAKNENYLDDTLNKLVSSNFNLETLIDNGAK